MLNTLPEAVWAAWLAAGCGIALWAGRGEERAAALLLLVAWLGSQATAHTRWAETQWGLITVDALLLAVLLGLALRSDRFWPLFATAFQLLACAGHLARALDMTLGGWAYLTSSILWSYFVVASLAAGAFVEVKRRPRPG